MSIPERLTAALADRYRIERELGAGGMATVYLAHDLRHDRRVALKVLKPELAAVIGAERFLAEIKTTANLQHPHILALFDSGQVEGTVFYVMPYVDGESLRDRIARDKQLPIEDALRIAREVGDALHHAHVHGVIHRDIKPENILLQGGHAQVADFGIALAASKTGGSRMTETGMSLGTPTYMSPEQAMGERALDARTDIYALGCVLYEMLTGDAPFTGSTAQAIVAKVLTEKPAPIIARRDRVPPHVEDAVLTALEKLPADRFATAAEFVAAIGTEGSNLGSASTRARAGARRAVTPGVGVRGVVLVALAVASIASAIGWWLGRQGGATGAQPSQLAIIESGLNSNFSVVARTIDITADGQMVIFLSVGSAGEGQLKARRLDRSEAVPMPIPGGGAVNAKLSPDGRFLYASVGGTLRRISVLGGVWTELLGTEATPWIMFGEDGSVWWSSQFSNSTHRYGPDGRDSLMFPGVVLNQILPGGRYGIGVVYGTVANSGTAMRVDLRTGETTALLESEVLEVKYTSGYLLSLAPDLTLSAVPFELPAGHVRGEPVVIASDVTVSSTGFGQWAVADNGTVAFIPGFATELVRVTRKGAVSAIVEGRERYHSPRISPDGRTIAVDLVRTDGRDIWLHSADARELTRATFQRDGHDPVWTPDGRAIDYLAGDYGRLTRFRFHPGTATPPKVDSTRVAVTYTGYVLPGAAGILTMVNGRVGRGRDIVRLVSGGSTVDTIVATPADESFVVPSPDGRWFAYVSDQSGRSELYLRSLAGSDVQVQVSLDGASEPVWSRDGRELFYRRPTVGGTELVAAAMQLGAQPRVLSRTALFDVSNTDPAEPHANYDVAPDGQSFVFVRRTGGTHIVVLQNVPELARRLARGTETPR